jgi:hypothetical protein
VLEADIGVSAQPFGDLGRIADEQVLLKQLERDTGRQLPECVRGAYS